MLRSVCVACGTSSLPYSYTYKRGIKCPKCQVWTCPACATILDRGGKYCKHCFSLTSDGK